MKTEEETSKRCQQPAGVMAGQRRCNVKSIIQHNAGPELRESCRQEEEEEAAEGGQTSLRTPLCRLLKSLPNQISLKKTQTG